jgi:hypothetical protein
MSEEKKGKTEETVDKTGEVVGKGLKKGWGAIKNTGKAIEEEAKKDKEKK